MPYYEVIFENGDFSLANSDEEGILSFARVHHQRAKSGLPGGPAGDHKASRIVKILDYGDNDPADVPRHVSKDVAKKQVASALDGATEEGVTDMVAVANAVEFRPLVESAPHESNFAAEQAKELDPSLWEGVE